MGTHEASRTLVKSAPELWAECSDAASLARHLGHFGEIRITRLEPESAVAWEGSAARGTVRLEPAGWGTKVLLTATAQDARPQSDPVVQAAPEGELPVLETEPPAPESKVASEVELPVEPEPPLRRGFLARLKVLFGSRPAPPPRESEPQPKPDLAAAHQPAPGAEHPATAEPVSTANPLDAVLDSLGSAHHRPYSRA
jgi:hypothetical protein